jgi:hypothetical protein
MLPRMIAASCYVGFVDGEPVAHVAFSTRPGMTEARACRLVVPVWPRHWGYRGQWIERQGVCHFFGAGLRSRIPTPPPFSGTKTIPASARVL